MQILCVSRPIAIPACRKAVLRWTWEELYAAIIKVSPPVHVRSRSPPPPPRFSSADSSFRFSSASLRFVRLSCHRCRRFNASQAMEHRAPFVSGEATPFYLASRSACMNMRKLVRSCVLFCSVAWCRHRHILGARQRGVLRVLVGVLWPGA